MSNLFAFASTPSGKFLLFQIEDGRTPFHCRFEDELIWLSLVKIVELFQTTQQNVTVHIKRIFVENSLVETATCKESLQVSEDYGRSVTRRIYIITICLICRFLLKKSILKQP